MLSFHFLAKFCTICCRNHFQVGRAPENLKMSWAIILRMHHDATSHFSWSLQLVENTASPLVEHHRHLQDAFRHLHHAHGEISPSSSTPHQWQMLADYPAMSFIFVRWPAQQIKIQMQTSWVGWSTRQMQKSTNSTIIIILCISLQNWPPASLGVW